MDHHKYVGLSQALFEESNEARFLLDAAMEHVLEVNAAGQRLCGFAIRDLIGAPINTLFRCQGQPGLGPLIGNGRRANRFEMQHCELRTFQTGVWLKVDVFVTRLCVKPEILFLVRVKDPASSSAQLKKDATNLRRLMSSVNASLWSGEVGPGSNISIDFLSPAIETLTGHPPEFFLPDGGRWHDIIHPDDRMIRADAQRSWALGESTDIDFRVERTDGSMRRVRETVQTESLFPGDRVRLFGVITDVSRFKP